MTIVEAGACHLDVRSFCCLLCSGFTQPPQPLAAFYHARPLHIPVVLVDFHHAKPPPPQAACTCYKLNRSPPAYPFHSHHFPHHIRYELVAGVFHSQQLALTRLEVVAFVPSFFTQKIDACVRGGVLEIGSDCSTTTAVPTTAAWRLLPLA